MTLRFLPFLACAGLLATSAPTVQAQASKPPAMSPEERARAQAKLNAQSAELNAAMPLGASREKLRKDVTPLRDTLIELNAVAARLTRAHTTKTESVVRSSAKQLRLDCAGAASVGAALAPNLAGLKTADTRANDFLTTYRTALANLIRALQACEKNLGTELGGKAPNEGRLNEEAITIQAAAARYTEAQRNVFDLLQIRMLPKGYNPHS